MRDIFPSFLVACIVFATLLTAAFRLPLTWDEPAASFRADNIPTNLAAWSKTEGHPQFPLLVISFGKSLSPSFLPWTVSNRLGPILLFSAVLGVVFFVLKNHFDFTTAFFCMFSILLVPRLFAHIQIAAWDSVLTSSWILSWALFFPALRSNRFAALYGVAVGMTVASKFPGAGVILPPFLWIAFFTIADRAARLKRKRMEIDLAKTMKKILLVTAVALATFFVLNPALRWNPFDSLELYYRLNTNRTLNISTLFLGKMYDLHHSLPWYNTLFWTAVTVPSGLLLLALFGTLKSFRDDKTFPFVIWTFLNMSIPLFMRSLPGAPVHDGVRLFVTAFPFLAILAGFGAVSLWNAKTTNCVRRLKLFIIHYSLFIIYGVCVFNMFSYAPQWLSYYNIFIGGLPGAVRVGMEPTYYWDSLDRNVVDWLNTNTREDETVAFGAAPADGFRRLKQDGIFRFDFIVIPFSESLDSLLCRNCRYYVLQRRSGAMPDRERELISNEKPVFVKTLHGVTLLEIYEIKTSKEPGTERSVVPGPMSTLRPRTAWSTAPSPAL